MISRALDKNNDLVVKGSRLQVVEDGAQVVQLVRCRLLLYMGEWYLNLFSGTPYFQQIFTKPANLANIESVLKTRIITTPGVLILNEFAMDYEGGSTRRLTVVFSANTIFGVIDNEKVTINA